MQLISEGGIQGLVSKKSVEGSNWAPGTVLAETKLSVTGNRNASFLRTAACTPRIQMFECILVMCRFFSIYHLICTDISQIPHIPNHAINNAMIST